MSQLNDDTEQDNHHCGLSLKVPAQFVSFNLKMITDLICHTYTNHVYKVPQRIHIARVTSITIELTTLHEINRVANCTLWFLKPPHIELYKYQTISFAFHPKKVSESCHNSE